MINQLYGEIREAQKFRFELLKWKILLVSGLSAVGLGMNRSLEESPLVLCLVPFACLYVDVLHRHYLIRGKINGEYLKYTKPAEEFERVFRRISTDIVGDRTFESLAVEWSTVLFSIGIVLIGVSENSSIPLIASGILGIVMARLVEYLNRRKRSEIEEAMERVIGELRAENENSEI